MRKNYVALFLFTMISAFSAKAQLEYKDVASIFYAHCTSCHHEGQHAPSMMNYTEVYNLSYAIQMDLQSGKMPPWSPDTAYSRFVHERVISQASKDSILNWITGGAIQGDTTLAPAPPVYAQYQLYGTPDVVLQIPDYTSTAGASDAYVCFSLPSGLTQDRILRAFEIVPGNPAIVHHVIVNADTVGNTTTDLSGSCFNPPGNYGIGGYAPGAPPTVFPGQFPFKAGISIKAGSNIIIQIHYPAGSAGQMDSTKIRMFFYPINETGIRPIHITTPLQNWGLYIPANNVATFTDTYPNNGTIPVDLSFFATFPHSHKICTSIVNYAASGADTIPLVKINQWDFNWQGFYTYPNLIKIPAGYKLYGEHVYDNTTNNPFNPHNPPVAVYAGTSTNDEMFFDGYMWLTYEPGDESIDIASILANDPLLNNTTTGINKSTMEARMDAYVYPNPASGKLNIQLSKKSEYKAHISTVTGQRVLETTSFIDNTQVDTKNIPTGVYIIDIIDSVTHTKITKKIIISNN